MEILTFLAVLAIRLVDSAARICAADKTRGETEREKEKRPVNAD